MLSITPKHKIYLAVQAIDFRRGIDGLTALCRQQFSIDPFSGHYVIFRNRSGSAIKILVYDSQGFWLCHKRLSKGLFQYWPTTGSSIVMLNNIQLQVLLQNGDPAAASIG
ncbi:IS66 family insertion sequence element accessory protein TnpB [Candidatus Dependentiae bacterium]|nr:IS66 family insertion sequence element accessory protein TnpB [Candidatus Dependentiae bacterium]